MTERASKGYWHRPIAELREQAHQELVVESHAWRTGLPLELAALDVAARPEPRLVEVRKLANREVVEPMGELVRRRPAGPRHGGVPARVAPPHPH